MPGADGVLGTADDIHEATNTTTPFVDQNQTYTSHPSHQVFLRDYQIGADGKLHSTGRLLTGADGHSMATWADVKANALKLGILLSDADVGDVPLLATDAYGNFILGANGFAAGRRAYRQWCGRPCRHERRYHRSCGGDRSWPRPQ